MRKHHPFAGFLHNCACRIDPSFQEHNRVDGRLGTAYIGLLTVTIEEFEIAKQIFNTTENIPGSAYYTQPRYKLNREVQLVHRRIHWQTNVSSVQAVTDMIEDFRPEVLFMIGTAGGHSERDAKLGDVVVADYIEYSGYWKLSNGVIEERKMAHDHPSLRLLVNFAEFVRVDGSWTNDILMSSPDGSTPQSHIGTIVSGNTLLGDPTNEEQQRILETFKKGMAFEMEGYGLCSAVYRARQHLHYNPQFLVVRGISDLVDKDPYMNQGVRKQWTPFAVKAAGTFAKSVVTRLLEVR